MNLDFSLSTLKRILIAINLLRNFCDSLLVFGIAGGSAQVAELKLDCCHL